MGWMKKMEPDIGSTPTASTENPRSTDRTPKRESRMEKIVNIGQSVQIKGELTGNEDLTIEGTVDGKIMVRDHSLTIGTNGRITAEVHAKTVVVVGQVMGNITADDKVEIAPSGSVDGDIRAPRVAISDGARFKGSIDMGGAKAAPSAGTSKGTGLSTPAPSEMPRSASAVKV